MLGLALEGDAAERALWKVSATDGVVRRDNTMPIQATAMTGSGRAGQDRRRRFVVAERRKCAGEPQEISHFFRRAAPLSDIRRVAGFVFIFPQRQFAWPFAERPRTTPVITRAAPVVAGRSSWGSRRHVGRSPPRLGDVQNY